MMHSSVENYMLVAKMGLTHLKTVIQLLKAINFKEVFIHLCIVMVFFLFFLYQETRIIFTYYTDSNLHG